MTFYLPEFIIYLKQLMFGYRNKHEQMLAEQRELDIDPYVDSNHSLRILDLANGRLRPQYTILKAAGHDVYGIDFVNQPQWSKTDVAYRVARAIYNWKLGIPRRVLANQTLTCGDVGLLPFPDNYFDLVTPAIEAELSDYSRDELTCGAYVIVARKA